MNLAPHSKNRGFFHSKDELSHHSKDKLSHHSKDELSRHSKDGLSHHSKDELSHHNMSSQNNKIRKETEESHLLRSSHGMGHHRVQLSYS